MLQGTWGRSEKMSRLTATLDHLLGRSDYQPKYARDVADRASAKHRNYMRIVLLFVGAAIASTIMGVIWALDSHTSAASHPAPVVLSPPVVPSSSPSPVNALPSFPNVTLPHTPLTRNSAPSHNAVLAHVRSLPSIPVTTHSPLSVLQSPARVIMPPREVVSSSTAPSLVHVHGASAPGQAAAPNVVRSSPLTVTHSIVPKFSPEPVPTSALTSLFTASPPQRTPWSVPSPALAPRGLFRAPNTILVFG